jgi:predicted RNase H-like HicB family nuclease
MAKKNNKIEIMKLEDDEGYLAYVSKPPNCMSYGKTPEEALRNLNDTIKYWIKTAKELEKVKISKVI